MKRGRKGPVVPLPDKLPTLFYTLRHSVMKAQESAEKNPKSVQASSSLTPSTCLGVKFSVHTGVLA